MTDLTKTALSETREWTSGFETTSTGYSHIIMYPDDPKRKPKESEKAWKSVNSGTIDEWSDKIMDLLSDSVPRSFNRISLELANVNANTALKSKVDKALWRLVKEWHVQMGNIDGKILFRSRLSYFEDAVFNGDDPGPHCARCGVRMPEKYTDPGATHECVERDMRYARAMWRKLHHDEMAGFKVMDHVLDENGVSLQILGLFEWEKDFNKPGVPERVSMAWVTGGQGTDWYVEVDTLSAIPEPAAEQKPVKNAPEEPEKAPEEPEEELTPTVRKGQLVLAPGGRLGRVSSIKGDKAFVRFEAPQEKKAKGKGKSPVITFGYRKRFPIAELIAVDPSQMPVILSLGMGVDSVAALVEWITNPESRDFPLSNLTLLTAQTGEEFWQTKRLVEQHLFPLIAAAGIRLVQVARAGKSRKAGYVVLDDSRAPTELHIQGAYRLSEELRRAGTVPQRQSGKRLCSIKMKGWPLDDWIKDNVTGNFRHIIGYNSEELRRALRDNSYSDEERHSEYPLIEWGWDRERCEKYLEDAFGEPWAKSCCTFCPFSGGKEEQVSRLAELPEKAIHAMMIEHTSLCLNPRQGLYNSGKSLRETLIAQGHLSLVEEFDKRLKEIPWRIAYIRRYWKSTTSSGRSLKLSKRWFRYEDAVKHLAQIEKKKDGTRKKDERGIFRVWVRERTPKLYPDHEEVYAMCPAFVESKERKGFEKLYAGAKEGCEA